MRLCFEVYYCCFVMTTLVHQVYGYKVHTALQNVVFTNNDDDEPADVHSEYFFGKCTSRYKTLIYNETKTYEDLKDRVFITVNLNTFLDLLFDQVYMKGLLTAPRCVYLRARSSYGQLVRYHAYKFNVCIFTVIYNYRNAKVEQFYYDWFFPVEMKKDIFWDLFFYE